MIQIHAKGWAVMIRKVYEGDPTRCPRCSDPMKVIAFIMENPVVGRIIDHLKLTFVTERPAPAETAFQEYLLAADHPAESFS